VARPPATTGNGHAVTDVHCAKTNDCDEANDVPCTTALARGPANKAREDALDDRCLKPRCEDVGLPGSSPARGAAKCRARPPRTIEMVIDPNVALRQVETWLQTLVDASMNVGFCRKLKFMRAVDLALLSSTFPDC
jgi:hypothetical protein